jgi:hypothetical protein
MTLEFNIQTHNQTAFGEFIVGEFLEKPPLFASDQVFRLGAFEFEKWGMPKKDVWTFKLVSDKTFNMVLEEQIVQLEIL